MVETKCKQCQTQNSAAEKFCVACGHKLERAEILALNIDETLKRGYKLVAAADYDQALKLARQVLEKNPQESAAYGLMAMVHEARGEVPAAIECYEAVVKLRPESQVDSVKLAQLKSIRRPASETPETRKFPALALAISAAVLTVAVGMAFAWPRAENNRPTASDSSLLADAGAKGFAVPTVTRQSPQSPSQQPTGAVQPPGEDETPERSASPTSRPNRPVLPPARGNRMPNLPSLGGSGPLIVDITADQLAKIGNASKPPVNKNQPETPPKADENVIERNPGQINISESRRAAPTDPNVSENIYRVAQNKMKSGDYKGAIRDFEAALSGSDRKAMIHQLIGRCHTRLGDKASAKQHFEAALAMYEAAGAKAAADSVRREIGLLG
jgi:tetratricopeptide (TPR) repeat protein